MLPGKESPALNTSHRTAFRARVIARRVAPWYNQGSRGQAARIQEDLMMREPDVIFWVGICSLMGALVCLAILEM